MKKTIITILIVIATVSIVIGVGSYLSVKKEGGNNLGEGQGQNVPVILAGSLVASSTSPTSVSMILFSHLPDSYVFENSTTTATGTQGTVKQLINTEGNDYILVCIKAKGGTATSTLSVRQQGSFNKTDFFDVASSTDYITNNSATTTVGIESRTPISFDPGTSTTTGKCYPIETLGYTYTRLLFFGEDAPGDYIDGVGAFIYVSKANSQVE